MSKHLSPENDPNWGFAIRKRRERPPIATDPREWARRTQSTVYIKKIKRSVEQVNAYLHLARGHSRGVSGHQRDACHYLLDASTVDETRRSRRSEQPESDAPVLVDSLKY